MTFSEMVFALGWPRHPICQHTRGTELRVVHRTLERGDLAPHHRAHLTIHADERAAGELVRDLRAAGERVEILHHGPTVTSAQLEAPGGEKATGLARVPLAFAALGLDGHAEPLVAAGGEIRGRLILAGSLPATEASRHLEAVRLAAGFETARLLRVAPIDPDLHVAGARHALAPDQEDILALAASMGYYSAPKETTLSIIAKTLGRSVSPVHKRLKSAEERLIGFHVLGIAPPPEPTRALPSVDAQTAPYEILVRLDGSDLGPSRLLAASPGARAHLQPVSFARDATLWSLLVAADASAQARLEADLAARPDVDLPRPTRRGAGYAGYSLRARERGAYHLPWWRDVWGDDAHLRAATFDGPSAWLRILLSRPHAAGRLEARLQESASLAGWGRPTLLAARPLGARGLPGPADPLTARQTEVLRVAHALGYYQTPRACTLEKVATTLGVSANAIHKNLVLAESKIIAAYLTPSA